MAKKDGRGQSPFHNDKSGQMRELLLELAPKAKEIPKSEVSGMLGKVAWSRILDVPANVNHF
jgi:hypothetical protein